MPIQKKSFTFHIAMIHRLSRFNIEPMAQEIGFSASQIPFMATIYKNPGISQDEISALVYIDKAATARQLTKLEKNGFITREIDPGNKRKKQIFLTQKGKDVESYFWKMIKENNERSLHGFSQEETEIINILLSRALENQINFYQED